jgi:tellurite resistance-related uncharacterized protein
MREWVLDGVTRKARLGTVLPCPLCDRAELPNSVVPVRTSQWDENTLPAGLRRAHQLAAGTWGRIFVRSGRLRFRAATSPPIEVELEAGSAQAIPPGVAHDVEPAGPVRFSLDFLSVPVEPDDPDVLLEEGGDPACWAGLVCPECGGLVGESGGHRPGCPLGQHG